MKSNWQTKKIGEVLEYEQPTKYLVQSKNYNDEYRTPVLTAGKTFILGKTKEEKGIFPAKDLPVIIFDDFTTATKFVDFPFKVKSSAMKILHPIKEISDAKFIFYVMQDINFDHIGIHKRYWISEYSRIEILIPPLHEQRRIVKILDEVFEKMAKVKENAEKNLKNAEELFESYLQNVFAKPGKEWEDKKLKDIFQIKPPKKEAREKLKDDDLVSFVPMEDMQIFSKEFICNKERKLKEVQGSYTYFANEDVLLAKITPCFENGKLGIARNLKNGIGFGSSEYIVFRSNGKVISDYLYYFLAREQFRKEGAKRMSGAVGHKRVSKEFIEESILPFPKSLSEQKFIVKKLDALSAETKKLEAIYKKKLEDLEELKKSVLKMAFNGEL